MPPQRVSTNAMLAENVTTTPRCFDPFHDFLVGQDQDALHPQPLWSPRILIHSAHISAPLASCRLSSLPLLLSGLLHNLGPSPHTLWHPPGYPSFRFQLTSSRKALWVVRPGKTPAPIFCTVLRCSYTFICVIHLMNVHLPHGTPNLMRVGIQEFACGCSPHA